MTSSQSRCDARLQQLVELFTAETSFTSPVDGSISTSSLSLVLSSLPSSTIDLVDSDSLPDSTASSLQSQLRCIPAATYHQLIDALHYISAASASDPSSTPPWTYLSQHAITARPLVAALSLQVRHLSSHSLLLASLYYALLTLPQPPLHLWNEAVATQLIALTAKWATQRLASGAKADGTVSKNGGGDDAEDSGDDEAMEPQGNAADENEVVQRLLRSLLSALSAFSLQPYPDVKSALTDALIALTRTQADDGQEDSPSSLAWSALRALCVPLHGEPSASWSATLKALLPNALMSHVHSTAQTPPLPLRLVAQSTAAFVLHCPSPQPLLRYLQHLALSSPDRAEYRRLISQSIVDCLIARPDLLAPFIPFLLRLSRNAKAGVRMTAIDLASSLVQRVKGGWEVLRAAVGLLTGRCSDRSPVVRARALVEVGRCLEDGDCSEDVQAAIVALLDESDDAPPTSRSLILSTPHQRQSHLTLATPLDLYTPATSGSAAVLDVCTPGPGTTAPSVGLQVLLHLLHRRCADAKAGVRRAAVVTLTSLLLLHRTSPSFLPSLTVPSLQSLFDACQDQSLLVRKQAMLSLTQLATAHDLDPVVGQVWLGAVLPLVDDAESTVRDKALHCVKDLVIDRVDRAMAGDDNRTVWQLLAALDDAMGQLMQTAVARLLQQGALSAALLRRLNEAAATSVEAGVWLLVEGVARQQPAAVDVSSVLQAWEAVDAGRAMQEALVVRLLSSVQQVALLMEKRAAQQVARKLLDRLRELQRPMSAGLIKAHVAAIGTLCAASKAAMAWEEQLSRDAERVLEAFVLRSQDRAVDTEEVVVRCLFTVGEIALVSAHFPPAPHACVALVRVSHTSPPVCLPLQRGAVKVSGPLLTFVQSLTAPTLSLPSMLSSPASAPLGPAPISNTIRAHAFICLGKLCLRDQSLSKKSLPLFIQALSSSCSPLVLRNNLLILLSDLCRTFTALVDPHLQAITACLFDSHPLLRRHAVLVLAQLLQEDYLKLKPSLLLPLLAVMADEEADIAQLARSALSHLLGQQGSKAQHAFMDAVFYLNGCAFSSLLIDPLPTSLSPSRRRAVFDFLLGLLPDEAKLMMASKLCQDVLGAVVDGRLTIEQAGVSAVVHDSLTLLSSDVMRFHSKGSSSAAAAAADDEADDADEPARSVDERLKAAKGKLLSQVAKKSALESIVPIVMELKRKMEAAKSPLVQPVLLYLQVMYGDWKAEMLDILSHDRQLAVEFEFDMRRMEEERRERSRRGAGRKATSSQAAEERVQAQEELTLQNVAAAVTASPSPPRRGAQGTAASATVAASPAAHERKAVGSFETPSKAPAPSRTTPSSAVFVSPRLKGPPATPQSGIIPSTRRVGTPSHFTLRPFSRAIPLCSCAHTAPCVLCAVQTSLRAAAPPVPLFSEAAAKASIAASPLSSPGEKENVTPLTVLFSPAKVDQRAKLRIDDAVIAAHCSAHSDAVATEEEDAAQPVGGAEVSTALQALSLSTGRKRRHRSDGSGGASEVQRAAAEAAESATAAVKEIALSVASAPTLRQSKRSRKGRGRNSGEADDVAS